MTGRGIARHGYPVFIGDARVGAVTSGSFAPFLQKNIGLVYVPASQSALGTEVSVEIVAGGAGPPRCDAFLQAASPLEGTARESDP